MKIKLIFTNGVALLAAAIFGLLALAPQAAHASGATFGDALNATSLSWQAIGSNSTITWFPETSVSHDADAAAQSGAISNNMACALFAPVTGPATMTFWWKVSSEAGHDNLRFYLDSPTTNIFIQGPPMFSISGEQDWQQKTVSIPSGTHTAYWIYNKNSSISQGADAGWVDLVSVSTGLPQVNITPLSQTVPVSSNVTFFANTTSPVTPVAYQWMLNSVNLTDETNQTLLRSNVGRKDRGTYGVTVTNINGATTVSNASLRVTVVQTLTSIIPQPDGSLQIIFQDGDNTPLTSADISRFTAQATTNLNSMTNLITWANLNNAISIVSGSIIVTDTNANAFPQRFYRVMEKY